MNRLVRGDDFVGPAVRTMIEAEGTAPRSPFTRKVEALFVRWRRHFGWV